MILWDLLTTEVEVNNFLRDRQIPPGKIKRENKPLMKLYIMDQVLWQ
jgi:hypothetical protein